MGKDIKEQSTEELKRKVKTGKVINTYRRNPSYLLPLSES